MNLSIQYPTEYELSRSYQEPQYSYSIEIKNYTWDDIYISNLRDHDNGFFPLYDPDVRRLPGPLRALFLAAEGRNVAYYCRDFKHFKECVRLFRKASPWPTTFSVSHTSIWFVDRPGKIIFYFYDEISYDKGLHFSVVIDEEIEDEICYGEEVKPIEPLIKQPGHNLHNRPGISPLQMKLRNKNAS